MAGVLLAGWSDAGNRDDGRRPPIAPLAAHPRIGGALGSVTLLAWLGDFMQGGIPAMNEEAFLQTILETPEDDAPPARVRRLVGGQRPTGAAEFITLAQCLLASLGEETIPRPEWDARLEELLQEHRGEWAGSLSHFVEADEDDPGYEFRRGFVEEIHVSMESHVPFCGMESRCCALHPVRMVKVRKARGKMLELARCPLLARLEGLDFFHTPIGLRGLSCLLESPHLEQLNGLGFFGTPIRRAGLNALLVTPSLAHVCVGSSSRRETPVWTPSRSNL